MYFQMDFTNSLYLYDFKPTVYTCYQLNDILEQDDQGIYTSVCENILPSF